MDHGRMVSYDTKPQNDRRTRPPGSRGADNSDVMELPPLSEATDPDALEAYIGNTSYGEVSPAVTRQK